MVEGLGERMETSRFLVDIEVVENRNPVAHHAKEAASRSAHARRMWSEVELGEVKHQRIAIPRIHGNGVGEMSVSLAGKEIWVRRSRNLLALSGQPPIHEVIVRMPELAIVIGKRCRLRDQANGELFV